MTETTRATLSLAFSIVMSAASPLPRSLREQVTSVPACAPLTPMQFNALYCLARPEVHTLSCGVAQPSDFDEHIRALEYYENAASTVAPIERRLRGEMEAVVGKDWCARWPQSSHLLRDEVLAWQKTPWSLQLQSPPLRAAARVAFPVLRWGHDRVVDMAVSGFQHRLRPGA